jgi:hypothetical protein
VYLYVNHLTTNELYPPGPADGMLSLPPCFGPPDFDAIYSHPLTAKQRQMKYFALEAMHDLRSPPVSEPPSAWRSLRNFAGALYGRATGLGPMPNSFFRRALRPNELFFVVSIDRLGQLVSAFLKRIE